MTRIKKCVEIGNGLDSWVVKALNYSRSAIRPRTAAAVVVTQAGEPLGARTEACVLPPAERLRRVLRRRRNAVRLFLSFFFLTNRHGRAGPCEAAIRSPPAHCRCLRIIVACAGRRAAGRPYRGVRHPASLSKKISAGSIPAEDTNFYYFCILVFEVQRRHAEACSRRGLATGARPHAACATESSSLGAFGAAALVAPTQHALIPKKVCLVC